MPPTVRTFDLFPTRIWQATLHDLAPHFPSWIAEAAALRAASPVAAGRTNRHGWNSQGLTILDRSSFADLRFALAGLCADAIGATYGAPVHFTLQSWINIHDRGGFNFAHIHDGCLLSGCFYLQVPEGSGPLVLRDPRPGVVGGPAKGRGPNACSEIRLQPEAGLAVLFPHWLEHYADIHDSDTPRIAIPFNAV